LIRESGEKAAALTRQLLAFSRKQVLEMQVVNVNSLIENMTKMLGRIIGEDIELEFKINTSIKKIFADPSQLEQVLMNLAINARDVMPRGGRFMIETTDIEFGDEIVSYHEEVKPGRYTMVAISDTGYGMTPEIRERIFEPFFTTKEKGKGTGLGLATVYGIVKQHNGYIYVYSEQGKGTTFKIYFPAMHGELKQAVEETDVHKPKGTETVLVVEDEPFLRKYLVDVLEPLGYKLLAAANGEEALDIGTDFVGDIHVLLTDVVLPGINGRELADKMSKNKSNMKVIFMSGYTDDVIAQHGVLEAGVNFLQKPVDSRKLAIKIREVLKEREARIIDELVKSRKRE